MSTNLPPRRPSTPIIRGPKPVTTRIVRPAGTEASPASNPTPKASPAPVSTPTPAPGIESNTSQQAAPVINTVNNPSTSTSQTAAESQASNQVVQPKRITTKPSPKAPPKPKEKSGVDPIKIILLLLVLMLGGVVGYLAYDKIKISGDFSAQAEERENALSGLKSDIDLKVAEISKLQDSLRIVITEKEALGIALSDEQARIADLESLKEQVQKKQLSINALNKKLNASRKEYESAQASVGNLAAENQRLVSEKVRLERLVQEKIDSIQNLAVIQTTAATVAAAPKTEKKVELKAESIMVIVYNTGGKEMKNPKAMMAGKIKASLNISAAYSNSETGSSREIYLRVIEPSGNTLYSGNKSFEADGKKVIYTEKQTIDFNNTKQRITFYYDKGSRYVPGRYNVEIWSDAKKIGQSEFVLQK